MIRKALLVLVCCLLPFTVSARGIPYALKFTNGTDMRASAAASATVNNLQQITVAMWVNITTTAPAAQRNFFGKGAAANRLVGFINATTISIQRGSSGTAPTGTVTTTNLPAFVANQPVFLVFAGDFGVNAPRIYAGNLLTPATEATSYTSAVTGSTAGHDDSADAFVFGNAGAGGTTNTLPGLIYTAQVLNRVPRDLAEIRVMQQRWTPRRGGSVLAWRLGANGAGRIIDESGTNNHGTILTAIPVSDMLPRFWLRPPT